MLLTPQHIRSSRIESRMMINYFSIDRKLFFDVTENP